MKSDHGVNRRDFMVSAALAAGALSASCSATFSQFGYRSLRSLTRPGLDPLPATRVYPPMPPATVAIAGVRGGPSRTRCGRRWLPPAEWGSLKKASG